MSKTFVCIQNSGSEHVANVENGSLHTSICYPNSVTGECEKAIVETGGLTEMDVFHTLVHYGYMFDAGRTFANINVNQPQVLSITVPAPLVATTDKRAGVHSRLEFNVIGGIKVERFSFTTPTDGTVYTPYNQNANYSVLERAMRSVFRVNPTVANPVQTYPDVYFGSTTIGAGRPGANILGVMEKIIKPETTIGIRITPLVDGTYITFKWYVYERYLNGGV